MIHFICVATDNKLYLPYLKQLIPDLVILGMGMKWGGFIMKYQLIFDYLKTLNDDDIVCIIDAYDILPTKNIIYLENRFNECIKKNPNVKMIIGCDKNDDNILFEVLGRCVFGSINNTRLNGGQYIGFVKNIKHIFNNFDINTFKDDQIELTKYAINNPNDIHIDITKQFFNVVTKPLSQVKNNSKACFIHANLNGNLEDFLLEEHSIKVSENEKISNYIINIKDCIKKVKMYTLYLYSDLIYSAKLGKFQSFINPPSYKLNTPGLILSPRSAPIISNLV
jgi:hypothetical protein